MSLFVPSPVSLPYLASRVLDKFRLDSDYYLPEGKEFVSYTPITGEPLGGVNATVDVDEAIARAHQSAQVWRQVPPPKRGELIRLFGEQLRMYQKDLGELITMEVGKIRQEGLGEVQEMIDICDFAVGLSRQLYGLTIACERPGHRMMETWHPLGVVGLITPFNFPAAVWAWNMALSTVCGNAAVWKPSEKAPLTAIACQGLFANACREFGACPPDLSVLIHGGRDQVDQIIRDPRIALVSATGGTEMGRAVGQVVASRFGRSLLELGGNNAMIVTPSADLDMALRAIAFGAVGTAGQRCTTLRRLFVHRSIYLSLKARLQRVYSTIRVGDPFEDQTLCGPLIDKCAYDRFKAALQQAVNEGGTVLVGGDRVLEDKYPDTYYVRPALVEMPSQTSVVRTETFGPILYLMHYDDFDEAVRLNNDVSAGLSSSIFTRDMREMEMFLSAEGSDCGIANVNIGTSGAEIGGAFGGEKETGGGRESGTDSWRNYMRRATNTINYSPDIPLAQGIQFDI